MLMIFWQFVSNSLEIFSLYSAQLEEYSAYFLLFFQVAEINLHLQDIQVDVCCTNLELYSLSIEHMRWNFNWATKVELSIAKSVSNFVRCLCVDLLISVKLYSSKFVQQTSTWMSWICLGYASWSPLLGRRARSMLSIPPTVLSIRKRFPKN